MRSTPIHLFRMFTGLLVTLVLMASADARPRHRITKRYRARAQNELSGGFGFAADLTALTPGGFKWFNDYGRHLGGPTWLNLQLNVTLGDHGGHCYFNRGDGIWICEDYRAFEGNALELGMGVKLKWRARHTPLQVHAKFGGAMNLIWFDDFYGTAVAFRSGFGLRYFFVPSFSIGAEVVTAVGPAFLRYDLGTELYAALDANFGVEWRF